MGGDEAKRLFDLVISEMKNNYQGEFAKKFKAPDIVIILMFLPPTHD